MGNKLLLADDSITIQKVVGIIFANEDYELAVVDNGDAALDSARQTKPDVVLVDVLMPGKTGYEVCEEMRRDPLLQNIPLLLLTGAFEPFDEEKARRCGADDYISKPFESQHLIDKVKRLIELGRSRAVAEPAEAHVVAAIQETTPVMDAPSSADEFTAVFFDDEEAVEVTPELLPITGELVEGEAVEDLWDTFELEEVDEGETGLSSWPLEPATADSAGELEVEEVFSFAEEEEAGMLETASEIGAQATSHIGSQWVPDGEQTFSFEEKPGALEFETFPEEEPFAESVGTLTEADELTEEIIAEPFSDATEPAVLSVLDAETHQTVITAPAMELQFAQEEYAPVVLTPAAVPPLSQAAEAAVISEDQLTAIISRISRELIEKIAWEVVPDLAEAMIKEEIRKIREGR
ncbi:MAG: response regulator [Geobacteraceae bacterium]